KSSLSAPRTFLTFGSARSAGRERFKSRGNEPAAGCVAVEVTCRSGVRDPRFGGNRNWLSPSDLKDRNQFLRLGLVAVHEECLLGPEALGQGGFARPTHPRQPGNGCGAPGLVQPVDPERSGPHAGI